MPKIAPIIVAINHINIAGAAIAIAAGINTTVDTALPMILNDVIRHIRDIKLNTNVAVNNLGNFVAQNFILLQTILKAAVGVVITAKSCLKNLVLNKWNVVFYLLVY